MKFYKLGQSGIEISRVGFGCMSLKGAEKENIALLQEAVDSGINFFDTADLYDKGANEELVGRALKPIRKNVVIATKVGNEWRPDGSGWDWNPTKEYILKAVDKSLQRLQTDYIDLYQLHGGTINDPIDEVIEAFETLKGSGKIKSYGISSIRPNVIREYVKRSSIDSVMMQYSLLDRRPEEECLPLLKQNNIGVLARGSVAQGLLIDKQPKPYLTYGANEVQKAAEAVNKLATDNKDATAIALQFAWHHPAITSAVVGIRTHQQLKEAVSAVAVEGLSSEEMKSLRQSIVVNKYEQHR